MLRDADLLRDLAPAAGRLFDRHLTQTKEWFPHELVPWGRGRDFDPAEVWDADAVPVDDAVRSSLLVNLLTEDNLPYYFHAITEMFGDDDVWGAWNRRWTAEEGRHAIVIRDYLTVTRTLDPVDLERNRMHQVSVGYSRAKLPTAADGMVYVALQELATRIAHRNTGKLLDDPAGQEVMKRVAADENFHYLFYRDLVTESLAADPSGTVQAVERQVACFEMPGTGIVDFKRHAQAIADAGIYDVAIHHGQILVPVIMRAWGIAELTGLNPEAEAARHRLLDRIDRIGRIGARRAERRQQLAAV